MPQSAAELAANAVGTAAAQGLKQAATSMIPDRVIRFGYFLTQARTTLTNPKESATFRELRHALSPICDPSYERASKLPRIIRECWDAFSYSQHDGSESICAFSSSTNLHKLITKYNAKTMPNPQDYRDYSWVTNILSALAGPSSLKEDQDQSLAKIFFGYIGEVTLSLATLSQEADQQRVFQHLFDVLEAARRDAYLPYFQKTETLHLLELIQNELKMHLTTPSPQCDTKFIPEKVRFIAKEQAELVSRLFKLLLILTEGGDKKHLSLAPDQVARGRLCTKDSTIGFNPDNPFTDLLIYAARLIPDLQKGSGSDLNYQSLRIPTQIAIEKFINQYITSGFCIFNTRFRHGSPLLCLLEQSPADPRSQKPAHWIVDRQLEHAHIQKTAQILYTLANWLRYQLYITRIVVDMDTVLPVNGQSWFSEGREGQCIQHFFTHTHALFPQFHENLAYLESFLKERLRTDAGPLHNIQQAITNVSKTSTDLLQNGFSDLTHIQKHYLAAKKQSDIAERRIFSVMSRFLDATGYGFTFNAAVTVSSAPQEAPSSSLLTAAALQTKQETPAISDCLKKITDYFVEYATRHGYQFNIPGIPQNIALTVTTSKANKTVISSKSYRKQAKHLVRVDWMYEFFHDLYSKKRGSFIILQTLAQRISLVLSDPSQRAAFMSRDVLPGTAKGSLEDKLSKINIMIEGALASVAAPPMDTRSDSSTQDAVDSPSDRSYRTTSPTHSSSAASFCTTSMESTRDGSVDGDDTDVDADDELISPPQPNSIPVYENLCTWITQYARSPSDDRKAFLTFFNMLCLIRQPWFGPARAAARLTKYHDSHLIPLTRQMHMYGYLATIINDGDNSGCPELQIRGQAAQQTIASRSAGQLSSTEHLDPRERALNRQLSIAGELREAEGKAASFRTDILLAAPHKMWPAKECAQLTNTLTRLLGQTPEFADIFLSTISETLSQQGTSPRSTYQALDAQLSHALTTYLTTNRPDQTALREYWAYIINGLLVLGADPFPWLCQQDDLVHVPIFMLNLATIILSHIAARSHYFGETLLLMDNLPQALITQLEKIAALLYECEISRLRQLTEWVSNQEQGNRKNRARLFWATVKWMYIVLNQAITVDSSPQAPLTPELLEAECEIETALTRCLVNKADTWSKKSEDQLSLLKSTISVMTTSLHSTISLTRSLDSIAKAAQARPQQRVLERKRDKLSAVTEKCGTIQKEQLNIMERYVLKHVIPNIKSITPAALETGLPELIKSLQEAMFPDAPSAQLEAIIRNQFQAASDARSLVPPASASFSSIFTTSSQEDHAKTRHLYTLQ